MNILWRVGNCSTQRGFIWPTRPYRNGPSCRGPLTDGSSAQPSYVPDLPVLQPNTDQTPENIKGFDPPMMDDSPQNCCSLQTLGFEVVARPGTPWEPAAQQCRSATSAESPSQLLREMFRSCVVIILTDGVGLCGSPATCEHAEIQHPITGSWARKMYRKICQTCSNICFEESGSPKLVLKVLNIIDMFSCTCSWSNFL